MDEKSLITTIQNHLDSALSVPTKTSGLEDERPVPVVLIEDWDTKDKNLHNSSFANEVVGDFDDDGKDEYERYLNFDFRTRVEFLVRHTDEVDVASLKDSVKRELRLIRENPLQFHNDLKKLRLGAGGNPTFQFTEPREAELMLSARFHGDHTMTLTPDDMQADTLETVNDDFTFNP